MNSASTPSFIPRVLLIGDGLGLPQMLEALPSDWIVALVAATNRPQYHLSLQNIAAAQSLPFAIQPFRSSNRYPQFIDSLKTYRPTHIVCFCYSMLVGEEMIDLVEGRALNIHASLLPKNRGPNPIQWALIRGEKTTGITLHLMSKKFDAGPILKQTEMPISDEDTWVSLSQKIDAVTFPFLRESLKAYFSGKLMPLEQDENAATQNERLDPKSPLMDFTSMSDLQIYNLVRAQVAPLSGAYFITADGHEQRFPKFMSLTEIAELRKRVLLGQCQGKKNHD